MNPLQIPTKTPFSPFYVVQESIDLVTWRVVKTFPDAILAASFLSEYANDNSKYYRIRLVTAVEIKKGRSNDTN